MRDRHTAIPACFIPPVASGLYGFDRARDLSNLFCWPWIPSHSQFMHLGGLMKPLSPAMMVYYKSTAGLMSFPTSETLLEGYHEDQTLRLTYIATDLSCLDPVHLRILSIPSHPIPSHPQLFVKRWTHKQQHRGNYISLLVEVRGVPVQKSHLTIFTGASGKRRTKN